jgi:hypothetical protein
MRPDIVPGAVFPDYELFDHTAKRRKLSELQGHHPIFSFSAAEVTAPRTAGRQKAWSNSTARWKLPTPGWSRSAPTTSPRRMNIAAESARTGLSSPTQAASFKKISTSLYTDPIHNPIIPHVIVLEPGLVVYKIYDGYWFWAGRPWRIFARTCVPLLGNAGPTGTSQHRTQSGVAARPQGTLLSVR